MAINLQDRELEILSMEKHSRGGFHCYGYDVENGHYYQFFFKNGEGVSNIHDHGDWFRGHAFFAGVIGKFNPYTWIDRDPYRVERGWGSENIEKCWEYFKRLWGGKESPWED